MFGGAPRTWSWGRRASKRLCLGHKDLLHHAVEVLSCKDLRGDLAHPAPLLATILGAQTVLHHKNALTQKILKVVEEGVQSGVGLAVLVELILQNVLHDLRIVGYHKIWRGHP